MKLLISFSGGETSAYMTKWLIDYNKQMCKWSDIKTVFANTGEENEETLEFVKECDEYFGFNTIWIEGQQFHGERRAPGFKLVDFDSAARNGEPFEDAIKKYGIPNQKFKDCTRNLKQKPIEAYAKSIGWEHRTYQLAIGIRCDEADRCSPAAKERLIIYPLVKIHPMTKPQINSWWEQQPFRLRLKHWQGNCRWCWKKSKRKHFAILRHQPEAFNFPLRMEEEYGLHGPEFLHDKNKRANPIPDDYRRTFFRGNQSAKDLIEEFRAIGHLVQEPRDDSQIFDPEFDVGGACEESCEVFADEDWMAEEFQRSSKAKRPITQISKTSQSNSLASKRFFSTQEINPRRAGTFGYFTHEIVMANPGLTYDELRKLGARPNDLRWDLERGWIKEQ